MSQAEAEAQRAEATLAQTKVQEGTLAADLAAAESALKAEQERVQRLQSLYKIQGVSLEQVQAAEASLATVRARRTGAAGATQSYRALNKANQAAADAARHNLRYAVITAPFNGVVSQRLAQTGDLATPGKPLLKILDVEAGNRLLVNAPDSIQPAGLVVDGELLPLTAWPEATAQGLRRYEARGGEFLIPGSRVDARLVVFRSPVGIRVPADCLLNEDGNNATLLALKGQGGVAAVQHQAHAGTPENVGRPSGRLAPQGHHQDVGLKADPHKPHHPPALAGTLETLRVTLAARGEEGAASLDASLAGRDVVCASPDILARIAAGAPFRLRAGR